MSSRRPFTFSIRSVLLCAAIISVVVLFANNGYQYRAKIQMLQDEGCAIEYNELPATSYVTPFWGSTIRAVTLNGEQSRKHLHAQNSNERVLRVLATIQTIETISFHQRPLATFPNGLSFESLEVLIFHATIVDEHTFPSELSVRKLEHLEFSYSRVSDNVLSNLKFPNLKTLVVRGSGERVTGDCFKRMACSSSLHELEFVDSDIRLEYLQHLEAFGSLSTLTIQFKTSGFNRFPHLPRLSRLTLYVDYLDERLIAGLKHLGSLTTLLIHPEKISPDFDEVVRSKGFLELQGRASIEEYFDSF